MTLPCSVVHIQIPCPLACCVYCYVSPLWRREILLYFSPSFVSHISFVSVRSLHLSYRRSRDVDPMSVYFCPVSVFCPSVCPIHFCQSVQCFPSSRRSNTRRWPNSGLMLAHCPRCWANISPVLGYHIVFGATLNVRQHHRQWANINPALVQSIMTVPTACRYCHHEVLTRAEWILASTSDAGPTFNRLCVGVGLYLPPAVSTTTPACYWTQLPANTKRWTSAGLILGQRRRLWASIGSALGQRRVCWECWQATLFFTQQCGAQNGIINSA